MGATPPSLEPLDTGLPESRVLVIGTGGTICMQEGPDGLQPSDNFLEHAMEPRPSFNDMSIPKCTSPCFSQAQNLSLAMYSVSTSTHVLYTQMQS